MLQSIGVDYVILGHSERRQYFHETDDLLAKKSQAVIKSGMTPIYCVGEPIEIRTCSGQNAFVEKQLQDGSFHLSAEEFSKIIMTYEPILAIGTGLTASLNKPWDMHAFISTLHFFFFKKKKKYNQALADSITILYGGSVKGSNARDIFCKAWCGRCIGRGCFSRCSRFLKNRSVILNWKSKKYIIKSYNIYFCA